MRLQRALLIGMASVCVGCQATPPTIVGEWTNNHPDGGLNSLNFADDGTATWAFTQPDVDTFYLSYAFDTTVSPHRLDLHGFDRGPLRGLSLYGIVEFLGPDSLRMDGRPALPGVANADPVRPQDFSAESQVYRRPAS